MSRVAAAAALLAVAVVPACAGAGSGGSAPLRISNVDELTRSELASVPDRLGHCSPAAVGEGDTVRVVLDRPHPSQMAVRTPDGGWRYVIHPFGSQWPSLMPPERFSALDTVTLVAGRTPAAVPVEGRDVEPIFTGEGVHRLLVLSHLGTDAVRPIWSCSITVGPP